MSMYGQHGVEDTVWKCSIERRCSVSARNIATQNVSVTQQSYYISSLGRRSLVVISRETPDKPGIEQFELLKVDGSTSQAFLEKTFFF